MKNPQFLPNHYETVSKYPTHEYQLDWVKIVDFLLIANFMVSIIFFGTLTIIDP